MYPKDTNRKIRTTFVIDCCVWILVPNSLQDMLSTFCARLTSPHTSPVFTALLLKPFLELQMYMNSVFLIFLLVSLGDSRDLKTQIDFGAKYFWQDAMVWKFDIIYKKCHLASLTIPYRIHLDLCQSE